MARMLTEEEVEKLEKQRALQQRESKALAGMSPDSAMRYREAQERQHWDDLYRQNHGGLSRGEVVALGPDGSGRQAAGIRRAAELQAAHGRELEKMGTMDVTREREAELKMIGMRGQGADAATIRANADKDMLGLTLADKENQREHEKTILGQTQTFQGTQNDAERKNRLDIAGVQGKSAVDAARAQAEARAAEAAGKLSIEQGKIDARNHATDTRAATAAAGQQNKLLQTIIGQKNALGQAVFTKEQQELLAKLLAQQGQ